MTDLLSRDISIVTKTVKYNTQHYHNILNLFNSNKINSLKQTHYLVEHEDVLPTHKIDYHPVLADYVDDQYTLRIEEKVISLLLTPT